MKKKVGRPRKNPLPELGAVEHEEAGQEEILDLPQSLKGNVPEVVFDNTLQYSDDLIEVLNGAWELLKHGGSVKIRVPLFPHPEAVSDPLICRFFTTDTFKYFHAQANEFQVKHKDYDIRPFRMLKQSTNGHYLEVELVK